MDLGTQHSQSAMTPVNQRLDSWKEIASHLRRDIRTVQLWEKNEGLPVHRHTHAARASVFAFTSELDVWCQSKRHSKKAVAELNSPPLSPPNVVPEAVELQQGTIGHRDRVRFSKLAVYFGVCLIVVLLLSTLAFRGYFEKGKPTKEHRPLLSHSSGSGAPVVAVLPFEDLSLEQKTPYLVDGFNDNLTSLLGQSASLRVIARHSADHFRNLQVSPRQIATELHADLLLEGSVTYSGSRIRITAHLVDAGSNHETWSQAYERAFNPSHAAADNMLLAQDDIAYNVATAVMQQVASDAPAIRHPVNVADSKTRTAYLMGRYYWTRRDVKSLQDAIGYFKQAIAEDSSYAPAYAGLADCYSLLTVWGLMPAPHAFSLARSAAVKALELDPDSAEAHTSLAFIDFQQDWNFAAAEEQFHAALKLDPSYPTAHQWYGEMLQDLGRQDQAITEFQRATELDPLAPVIGSERAMGFAYAGRPNEALSALKQLLSRNPDFAPSHLDLSNVYAMMGDWPKAEEERTIYTRLTGDSVALDSLRFARSWAEGRHEEALRQLHLLQRRPASNRLTSFQMAEAYMRAGDREKALLNLEQGYNSHVRLMVTMMLDPMFVPLHQDPRFQDLAKHIGIRS